MVGHVTVQELDWSIPDQYSAVIPPFDYVLAADCVYHEHIIEDLLRTVLAVTHSKSIGTFWSFCSCLEILFTFTSFCLVPASKNQVLRSSCLWLCLCSLWMEQHIMSRLSCLDWLQTSHILNIPAVVVVNELRSETVHSRFTELFEQHFTIKRMPRSKMDAVHQHRAIDILILKRRKAVMSSSIMPVQSSGSPS